MLLSFSIATHVIAFLQHKLVLKKKGGVAVKYVVLTLNFI